MMVFLSVTMVCMNITCKTKTGDHDQATSQFYLSCYRVYSAEDSGSFMLSNNTFPGDPAPVFISFILVL